MSKIWKTIKIGWALVGNDFDEANRLIDREVPRPQLPSPINRWSGLDSTVQGLIWAGETKATIKERIEYLEVSYWPPKEGRC